MHFVFVRGSVLALSRTTFWEMVGICIIASAPFKYSSNLIYLPILKLKQNRETNEMNSALPHVSITELPRHLCAFCMTPSCLQVSWLRDGEIQGERYRAKGLEEEEEIQQYIDSDGDCSCMLFFFFWFSNWVLIWVCDFR
ncbi:hypothetical protein RchiOBHm_Chr2g0137141 [Rosa chinensis]|uniref:Uncharacterized protein n=1 Tax=Rosa chinensis TaxID=74649 RepID=A0A2P6RWI2_ROSCH|nr:hypothetical protein RchiOBHm_Chr2g0137141 [Rosa chinensis]